MAARTHDEEAERTTEAGADLVRPSSPDDAPRSIARFTFDREYAPELGGRDDVSGRSRFSRCALLAIGILLVDRLTSSFCLVFGGSLGTRALLETF